MKNILIINLKRFGDIFSSGHLISSIKDRYPSANINLLVMDEFSIAAKMLGDVDNVFSIDRKRIEAICKNKIYSNGLALESLFTNLDFTHNTTWDSVFNFSNDKTSLLITSYVTFNNKTRFHGLRYDKNLNIEFSNNWSVVFNDVLTSSVPTPIHFQDIYKRIMGDITISKRDIPIKTNERHDKTAKENIDNIKDLQNNSKIIGVQFKASSKDKSFNIPFLICLIGELIDDQSTYPVLLTSPSEEERSIVNEINQYFSNTLITIETDFIALPSILKNIDAVVTPDTSIKHLCDLMRIPILEIALGKSPIFKQGSFSDNSFILTNYFSKIDCDKDDGTLAKAIIKAMVYGEELPPIDNDKFTLYSPELKNNEIHYRYLDGMRDDLFMLGQMLGAQFIKKMFNDNYDAEKVVNSLQHFSQDSIRLFLDNEKRNISIITKELLSALRLLARSTSEKNNLNSFTQSLEKLLYHCENNKTSTIATSFFRAKIENLTPSSDINATIKNIERLLFNLKSDLQTLFSVIKDFEKLVMPKTRTKVIEQTA